ncbi:MAG: hypothetical protein HY717_02435 [Planctomycetes bacterium]|nr:hypothetical protein [Planctomycetota bacterium]
MYEQRKIIRQDRVRTVPQSFSWIDRELLHRGFLKEMSQEELLLYFFLVLVAGPEGTSFWGYRRIGEMTKLTDDEIIGAIRALSSRDLIAFSYPTFQVLSIPGVPFTKGAKNAHA